MRETKIKAKDAHILYDADVAACAQIDWFEPDLLAARGWLTGSTVGRGHGRTQFFNYQGTAYVLRHYRRGGQAAAWLDDRYLWTGLNRTRAWREWRLLARMAAIGLPAPRPFAARVVKSGLFYRADLITLRIPASLSLTETLNNGALPDSTWREIGRAIAKFHLAGIWHADLNAHNVLLEHAGGVALVDFDRAKFRPSDPRWREANLARLLRSLRKLKRLNPELHFREVDFELLREGYNAGGLRHTILNL